MAGKTEEPEEGVMNRRPDNPTFFTSAPLHPCSPAQITRRLNYYRRIFAAYLTPQKSQLTFWHEVPEENCV